MFDVIVIGAGPAGVVAALRAADLGANTALITRDEFGGMAANDGPVPVRTLAHAARLIREARQLGLYGISVSEPVLDYPRLLARVREVVNDVRAHSAFRRQIDSLKVTFYERAGTARFADPHTIETESGLWLQAEKIIICTGGVSRRLSVPGFELTATHSDAWALTSVPPSMLVIGAGATGTQVASIFNAFGSRVQLFQAGPRILPTEDEDVSTAVAVAFRESGIVVRENFGGIESFAKTPSGVRMIFSKDGARDSAEAALAIVAVGWVANTAGLNLATAGVETDQRGFVRVNAYLRTSAPHIFAAGDNTGRLLLVPQAIQDGFVAATNAVRGATMTLGDQVSPIGSFTEPEYAQVGLTEAKAREKYDVLTAMVRFDSTTRHDHRRADSRFLQADR
jgi:pyruvate/2-oxoglutarate dehydrogenase complex dihydrolipoamide dehydrogenase (E3) component